METHIKKEGVDPFGNGIGWALGKIYRDHLKLPVPDYLRETFPLEEKEVDVNTVPPQGQNDQI